MPFLIASDGYKLPTAAGEPWIITQGPYGTFSHWGNALHAFDIAPQAGRCIVSMKGGIAYTHDLGLAQDHRHRSFGNYITIDHGNGEYSHYAHLATGSFVVENGQRVEQGQALATVGNSGYTLGEGGGYHVHVSVTRGEAISSPSVPFQFQESPQMPRARSIERWCPRMLRRYAITAIGIPAQRRRSRGNLSSSSFRDKFRSPNGGAKW